MTLVPMLFSDWWEDLERPHRLFDQNFGLAFNPEQLMNSNLLEMMPTRERMMRSSRCPMMYYRPWGDFLRNNKGGGMSTVQSDKDQFQVILDVQQFKPEEISVKVVDKFVIVEGKHEERKDDHGWISRQFNRRYIIPEQCEIDQVSSSLSSDGVLTIIAPRKEKPQTSNERSIKIEQTGKPAMQNLQEQKHGEEKEGKKEEKKEIKEKKEEKEEEKKKIMDKKR